MGTLTKCPNFGSMIRYCTKCITLHLALSVLVLKVHGKVSCDVAALIQFSFFPVKVKVPRCFLQDVRI